MRRIAQPLHVVALLLMQVLHFAQGTSRTALTHDPPVFPTINYTALGLTSHPVQRPAGRWAFSSIHPTNVWWITLGINDGSGTFTPFPYTTEQSTSGFRVCAPKVSISSTQVDVECLSNVVFGYSGKSSASFEILSSSDLGVVIREKSFNATIPLVRGNPFISVLYENISIYGPKLTFQSGISKIEIGSSGELNIVDNSATTWIVYGTDGGNFDPKSWTYDNYGNVGLTGSTSTKTLWVRVAACDDPYPSCDLLLKYKDVITVDGKFDYTLVSSEEIEFSFEFFSVGPDALSVTPYYTTSESLLTPLMFAMPHHLMSFDGLLGDQEVIDSCGVYTSHGYVNCTTGRMWVMRGSLPNFTWDFNLGWYDCERKLSTLVNFEKEWNFDPGYHSTSVYWYGKNLQRLARFSLIANNLGKIHERNILLGRLEKYLTNFFDQTTYFLGYEPYWGGILLDITLLTFWNDFGSGWYNDHHFHYGYLLYPASVLAHFNATWAATYKPFLTDIIRDIANPVTDKYFPAFRYFDCFVGHSWAGGLFSGERNQESTSEAVNAWYGIHLLGKALGDTNIEALGAVLLYNEVKAAQTYWHMSSAYASFGSPYGDHKMTGIMWGSGANYATYFGANPEFIHLIHMLPFTPITEMLIPHDFVLEQWPVLSSTQQGYWTHLQLANHAIIAPAIVYHQFINASDSIFDTTLSRTEGLYWTGTRPAWGFVGDHCPRNVSVNDPTINTPYCSTMLIQVKSDVQPDTASITANGYKLQATSTRGIQAAILDYESNRLVGADIFDTEADSQASSSMISWINTMCDYGDTLILATAGEVDNFLTTELKTYVNNNFRTSFFGSISRNSSYIMIGRRYGIAPVAEAVSPRPLSSSYMLNCTDTPFVFGCVALIVKSAGFQDGNTASIIANGNQLLTSPSRGLSAVVFDGTYTVVKKSGSWDTYGSTAASNAFATWINNSVSTGDYLAIAAKDDASSSLTQKAKTALKSLYGATKFSSLGFRSSYAFIGRKGNHPIAEAISAAGHGFVNISASLNCFVSVPPSVAPSTSSPSASPSYTHFPTVVTSFPSTALPSVTPTNRPTGPTFSPTISPTTAPTVGCGYALQVTSSGFFSGSRASVVLNSLQLLQKPSRGLNCVLLDSSMMLKAVQVFDTYASQSASTSFVHWVNTTVTGTDVLIIAVYDDASNMLTQAAKNTMAQKFGSPLANHISYRSSFAMISSENSGLMAEAADQFATVKLSICLSSNGSNTEFPTSAPTQVPSANPTLMPTRLPTSVPTIAPTPVPTVACNNPLVVSSSGFTFGSAASVMLRNVELLPHPSRGLNCVLLDSSLSFKSVQVFDTYAQKNASSSFVTWANKTVASTDILVVTVYDDASHMLTQPAKDLLHNTYGSSLAFRISYRGSYAMIGSKTAGLFSEAAAPYFPVTLTLCLTIIPLTPSPTSKPTLTAAPSSTLAPSSQRPTVTTQPSSTIAPSSAHPSTVTTLRPSSTLRPS